MRNQEKLALIQKTMEMPRPDKYYDLLEKLGDLKGNYWDYMTTEPINCNEELKRLPSADYELCTALLTMLLREDHFCNGAFERRYAEGEVTAILEKMVATLIKSGKTQTE